MIVPFNVVEMNGVVIDEAIQTFKSLMKIHRDSTSETKSVPNVATSTKKFHRGSTSETKFVPSSFATKKWKKNKGCQGNKANPIAAKTSKKAKTVKGICFHCNWKGHWKRKEGQAR
ncbi:gag/pol protein [Cucumis melo var. makuwa]|uniref:Gag/pol protein n=1 Tax=Cucumis melo var. makuwa TaxID=1194695 RepID=A0A5A7T5Q2_CUCMM|nr:gag/pol protein [Cucumis melo var. makuwa]TYJ95873.1 gag/pol protein [Cucumis melo var. makuwa]